MSAKNLFSVHSHVRQGDRAGLYRLLLPSLTLMLMEMSSLTKWRKMKGTSKSSTASLLPQRTQTGLALSRCSRVRLASILGDRKEPHVRQIEHLDLSEPWKRRSWGIRDEQGAGKERECDEHGKGWDK